MTKKEFLSETDKEASGDQRATWKIIKQLIGKDTFSTKTIELKEDSGLNLTEPRKVGNCLNASFTAIGSKLASELLFGANNITP